MLGVTLQPRCRRGSCTAVSRQNARVTTATSNPRGTTFIGDYIGIDGGSSACMQSGRTGDPWQHPRAALRTTSSPRSAARPDNTFTRYIKQEQGDQPCSCFILRTSQEESDAQRWRSAGPLGPMLRTGCCIPPECWATEKPLIVTACDDPLSALSDGNCCACSGNKPNPTVKPGGGIWSVWTILVPDVHHDTRWIRRFRCTGRAATCLARAAWLGDAEPPRGWLAPAK